MEVRGIVPRTCGAGGPGGRSRGWSGRCRPPPVPGRWPRVPVPGDLIGPPVWAAPPFSFACLDNQSRVVVVLPRGAFLAPAGKEPVGRCGVLHGRPREWLQVIYLFGQVIYLFEQAIVAGGVPEP